MPLREFSPFRIEDFLGLNTFAAQNDVPVQYSPGPCRNIEFTPGGFKTRRGTATEIDLGAGTDIFHMENLTIPIPFTKYRLVLMQDRKLYYATTGSRTLLLDNPPLTSTTKHFKVSSFGDMGILTFSDGFMGTTAPYVTYPKRAQGTLSATANPANNDTVTIDGVVYTFKTALSTGPTVANEILIETAQALSLGNLAAAINGGEGQGVRYSFGTVAHPTVRYILLFYNSATPSATLTVEATLPGTTGNSITTTESSGSLSWGGAVLSGGGDLQTARPASIAPASLGTMAAADGAADTLTGITAGVHKLRVVFENDHGFRTRPTELGGTNNDGILTYTAPGDAKVTLTNVPVHPDSSIKKRHIVMTEAELDTYYIFYTADNNTTTTFTNITIPDAQLKLQTEVSDYFQYISPLPGAMGSIVFHNRLITWGDGNNLGILLVSEPGQVETFRGDVGLIEVRVDDGQRIVACFVLRDGLYVVKERSIHHVNDNGGDPAEWPVVLVSEDCGTNSPSGVSMQSDEEFVAIQDPKGVYVFTGLKPEKMSQIINPTWMNVNYSASETGEIHIDTVNRRIFNLVPTGSATQPDKVYVLDYEKGWDHPRWIEWETDGDAWRSMIVEGAVILVAAASKLIRKFTTLHTAATAALTASANVANNETVTIAGRIYTFKTALTSPQVANEVLIGGTANASLVNLAAAINRTPGAGTNYSLFTTRHATVNASVSGSVLTVTARTKGTAANALVVTEASGTLSWGAGTLAGGVDNTDNGTAIDAAMRTGNIEGSAEGLNYFGRLIMHAIGAGTLAIKIYGPDGSLLQQPSSFTLSGDPERDMVRTLNTIKDRIFLEFSQTGTGDFMEISRITPMIKPVGLEEPESVSV